jgi:LDH2 family malate/lactate/ureidoglycolate dehydrogenase
LINHNEKSWEEGKSFREFLPKAYTMPTFTASQLRNLGIRVFEALGTPSGEARRVADSLVKANLAGHDSHGVMRIPQYVEAIKRGQIKPGAKMEVVRETPSTTLIDGKWGFGQVIAEKGTKMAIEKARVHSISAVGLFHCNHIGRLGEYSFMAAEQDMIGIVMCNAGPPGGYTAPYGGRARRLSTGPISASVPAGRWKPFLLDFATSTVAEGKLRIKSNRGEKVPLGWIIDREGHPTTDPKDFYEGGAILPFGDHKGYALSLLIDILGGALTGGGCVTSKEFVGGNGTLIIVINISSFTPLQEFKERIDALFEAIKGTPTAMGFKEVMMPGEPEFRTEEKRLKKGIFIEEKTWQDINKVVKELELNLKEIME